MTPSTILSRAFALTALLGAATTLAQAAPKSLFDGKSFKHWEGDTNQLWHIRDGLIVGGNFLRVFDQVWKA